MPGRLLSLLLTLSYPFIVLLALSFGSLDGLGIVMVLLGTMRILLGKYGGNAQSLESILVGLLMIALGILIVWSQTQIAARLYPVFINCGMLGWFGWSLLRPPSVVEQFARLAEPDLPDYAVSYTRAVTRVWCLFFFANGLIALFTAFYSSLEVWTLYNGGIAYLLMGILFTAEYVVRQRTRMKHEATND